MRIAIIRAALIGIIFFLAVSPSFAVSGDAGVCILPPQSEKGKDVLLTEQEKLFRFAENLFSGKEYYRAITEYMRFINYYPSDPLVEKAVYQAGNCYFMAEKWDDAIKVFKEFTGRYPDSQFTKDVLRKTGESYLKKGDIENSKKTFDLIEEKYPEDEVSNRAKISLGIAYLENEKFNNAVKLFGNVKETSRYKPLAEKLMEGTREIEKLPQKSPLLAGLLSAALPGAGQLYTGRMLDSLFAFLLNGVFTWGIIESFNRDVYVAAGILSFFELGWYSGNIYNAISDAHKYNRDTRRRLIDELKQNSISQPEHSLKERVIFFSYRIEF